jgi:hypothetical protein
MAGGLALLRRIAGDCQFFLQSKLARYRQKITTDCICMTLSFWLGFCVHAWHVHLSINPQVETASTCASRRYPDQPFSEQLEASMTDRRRFLARSAAAIATSALAPSALLAAGEATAGSGSTPPALDRASFEARLGQSFSFHDLLSGKRHELLLAAVEPGRPSPGLEQFALGFHSRLGSPLDTGTYLVEDSAGQTFALFVQSGTTESTGNQCRADFCLFRGA